LLDALHHLGQLLQIDGFRDEAIRVKAIGPEDVFFGLR
jgi:hypothetical protein